MKDQADDCSLIAGIVSEWYGRNPGIRQLQVYEAEGTDDVHVVVALAPVCDSDDTSPIWLAKCARWQRQLQRLIGRRVHLDWFDADSEVPSCAEPRACLASVAWRDCCTAQPDFMSVDTSATPSSNRPDARRLV